MAFIRIGARFGARWLILATALMAAAGCVSPRIDVEQIEVEPAVVESATRFRREYVLAPGDQIEVAVRRAPEISRVVPIRPDGYISLPLIDEVQAAGLTPRELDEKLTEMLAGRLLEPDVTVIAQQVRQPVVYVVGDVQNNSAAVPLRDAPTAAQAVAWAGGLRRSAADVTILRLSETGHLQAIPIKPIAKGQPAPYAALRVTLLQPDDVLFVGESGRSQVARLLEDFVNRPLLAVNALVGTFVNFRFAEVLDNQN